MKLDGERPLPYVVNALAGAVVCIGVAHNAVFHTVADDGVAVVLAGDEGAHALRVSDGLIAAAMAVLELLRIGAL